jgi:hypothetical protein
LATGLLWDVLASRQDNAVERRRLPGLVPSKIFEDVLAVHTLAHEVWHLHGISNEASTECDALQTTAAQRSCSGPIRSRRRRRRYTRQRLYPNLPDEYRRPDCVNRGPLDLRPADPIWP